MSDERRSRRSTEGAQAEGAKAERDGAIDLAIDEVARQMTTGELPSDFRARIVARLDAGDRPQRFWPAARILSPIAAAAVVAVAIFVARGSQRHDGSRPPAAHESSRPVAQVAAPTTTSPSPSPHSDVGGTGPLSPRSRFGGTGKADATYATSEIDALAPARLEVAALDVQAMPTESIAVPQLDAIAPIAVEPLPANDQRP